jgi:hypothetical protein
VAEQDPAPPDTVESIAALYLGNILYALERCALSFDPATQQEEAAFYRGLAAMLAEARGRDLRR